MGSALVAGASLAAAQGSGSAVLKTYADALSKAESVQVTFTMMPLGGSPDTYSVKLLRPNKAWIERPGSTTVADGETITVWIKKDNSFYKKPQKDSDFRALFTGEEMTLLAPFFNGKHFDGVAGSTAKGTKNRKGISFKVVEVKVDKNSNDTTVFYVDPSDGIAKQAELNVMRSAKPVTLVLDTKNFVMGSAMSSGDFALKLPSDAKEISEAELASDKWYYDLEEAKKVAASTNRKIFVDFFATWCGPCKKLAAEVFPTAEFKNLSKYFVFLQIDVDAQKGVSQAYNIEAMPTQMVLNADGSVVGKKVGYANPADFFAFINQYTN